MIQKIQPLEIPERGIATESKVEVQSRFTNQNRAIIYYDLRDPNGTTPVLDLSTNQYVTLPYRILFYNKIIVTGEDKDLITQDEKQAIEIFKRERTDIKIIAGGIKLAISDDPKKACEIFNFGEIQTYYLDTDDLTTATILSETEDMKLLVIGGYYVTDGKTVRYWDGKSFDFKFLETCKF